MMKWAAHFLLAVAALAAAVAADGKMEESGQRKGGALPDSVADAFASVRDGIRRFKSRRIEQRQRVGGEKGQLEEEQPEAEAVRVLSQHVVRYSDPPVDERYASSADFNPRGMKPVYRISKLFMSAVQRDGVLPPGVNKSAVLDAPPEKLLERLAEHWADFLLQYVGVVTASTCGLLLAVIMPVACLCTCCCRCAGKCGAYPEHFDKRSDSCKRFSLGVVLAVLVILATFGVVAAFVTNYFVYEGSTKLPERLDAATSDTRLYLSNTASEVDTLLVGNFNELEEVLNQVLDESGPILKRSLAEVTQAVAIDDLTQIVSNLGVVKRHLRDIQTKSQQLQDYVGQLRLGLNGTSVRLLSALRQCAQTKACADFLSEYDVSRDLAVAANFSDLPTNLPDLTRLMQDISALIENDVVSKVRGGQEQLDRVKEDIQSSIGDIVPRIKRAIRAMGAALADQSAEINRFLDELSSNVATVKQDVPEVEPRIKEYSRYYFYIGLGASFMLLLMWMCYVFGLFFGFCGKRPGNVYGDDCCNKGTGANW